MARGGEGWRTVVNEADQVEPVLIRVQLPDPLSGLERVHDVREIRVRVALVNHQVQQVQRPHDRQSDLLRKEEKKKKKKKRQGPGMSKR